MAIINGTDRGETLLGTPDADAIDGKDAIRAQGGVDTLIGGTGKTGGWSASFDLNALNGSNGFKLQGADAVSEGTGPLISMQAIPRLIRMDAGLASLLADTDISVTTNSA